ncbi:hypothetical protein [Nocardioides sp. TF02-7]|uniref:hypothetical protein n=1 Tax=Nocardioides sp. TF02-7 TaxID=2917724 RepID=UPI0023DBD561|nr:hypothetical protein [Nocardioides sp. TF02-7]
MHASSDQLGEQVAAGVPGDDRGRHADEEHDADVAVEADGRGDRTGVGRDEGVHGGERACGREGVEQQGAAEPAGDGEDDREEDHEPRVEEDREAEQQ